MSDVYSFFLGDEEEDEDEGVGFCLPVCLAVRLSSCLSFWLSKAGLPPILPATALTLRRCSSLRIRREKIVPSASRLKTPAYSNSLSNGSKVFSVSPTRRAICGICNGCPLIVNDP